MHDALGSARGLVLLALVLLCVAIQPGRAQGQGEATASLQVKEVPLGRALERLSGTAGVSLVYDFGLVAGRRTSCSAEDESPSAILGCLLEGHPIDYVQTSKGTYILQEAVQEAPQWGTVTGVVRDAERDVPLASAHVRLPEAEQLRGTVTDSSGAFELTRLKPGPHTILVTRVGYARHEATLFVPPDGRVHHEVTIAPVPIRTESVIVDGDQYGALRSGTGTEQMSAEQMLQVQVGQTPDVLAAASTLLGVSRSAPYADLHIQGSATQGHTLRLDGVPIRNPVSMGRLLGAFSPLALDGITAYKAGFGVSHGNARSGAIEVDHDLSDRGAQYGTVQLDGRSMNARLRGATTIGGTPVTAMVAGRMSVWDLYQDAALTDLINRWSTLDPVLAAAQSPADTSFTGNLGARTQPNAGFYDLHGALRFDFGAREELYASAYHGGSHLGADLMLGQPLQPEFRNTTASFSDGAPGFTLPTHDGYAWTNTAALVRYETPVTARSTGHIEASVSRFRSTTSSEVGAVPTSVQNVDPMVEALSQQNPYVQEGANEVTEVAVEGRVDAALSARSGVELSVGGTYQGTRFRVGNAFASRLRHRAETVQLTSVGEATIGVGAHTTMEGGVRVTALPFQSRLFAEPRGVVRYSRETERLGTVGVRIGGGLYRQFTTQFELIRDGATAVVPTTHVWLPITSSMAPSTSYHLASGLTWQPSSRWQLDVEGFRKWQPHLLAVDYAALRESSETLGETPPPSQVLGSSRGDAYGGGVHLEYDGASVTGSVRYDYTRAQRTFPGRFGGRLTPVPWSEPHRVSLNTDVPLGYGVSVQLRGEGVWGRRWGYRRAYYAYLTPADLGDEWSDIGLDNPGQHRLSPLYRLDTGVTVEHGWNGVRVQGELGIENLLNRRNVADWALQPGGDGTMSRWTRPLAGRRATVTIQVRY